MSRLDKSLFKANSTLAPLASDVCFTVRFLPADISTVLPLEMVLAAVSDVVSVLPVDLTFQEEAVVVPPPVALTV